MTIFRKSVAAGIMIAIGSTIYLLSANKVVGALLFSIGLFLICSFEMCLFTGKIGYIFTNKNKPNCAVIWAGNFIGSIAASVAVRIANPSIHKIAAEVAAKKASQSILSIIILSFFCGILMYLAVDNFVKRQHTISGIVGIVLCVSVFILCGFEHSIADMNYFALGVASLNEAVKYLILLVVISVCNGLGSLAIRQLVKN